MDGTPTRSGGLRWDRMQIDSYEKKQSLLGGCCC